MSSQITLLLSTAFSLFLLMNAIGNIPAYLSVLSHIPHSRHKRIVIRELLIALFAMVLFAFLGEGLLDLLQISQETVLLSGGIILFIISLRLIFPTMRGGYQEPTDEDPFIVPLAIPLVAGPSVLAAIIIYSHQLMSKPTLLLAILIAWLASTAILLSASLLKRFLGKRAMIACERLMGLLLTLIAIQMLLRGIHLCIESHLNKL